MKSIKLVKNTKLHFKTLIIITQNTWKKWPMCLNNANVWRLKDFSSSKKFYLEFKDALISQKIQCKWFHEKKYLGKSVLPTLDFLFFRLPQIYEEFYHTVNNADHEKDLKWWSNTYGVNMPMNWPQFEVSNSCLFIILFCFFKKPWVHIY